MPYLIDDKDIKDMEGKSEKEQFTIKIDSVRKALGIDSMEDVEYLVLGFYEFSAKYKADQTLEDLENEENKDSPDKVDGNVSAAGDAE